MSESKPMKNFLKTKFSMLVPAYRGVRQWASELRPKKSVFNAIYQHRTWDDLESISGPGSNLKQTEGLRAELPGLLAKLKATSLLDAPCGDFNWMRETKLDLDNYIGADIVPDLIEENREKFGALNRSFVVLDLTTDVLPAAHPTPPKRRPASPPCSAKAVVRPSPPKTPPPMLLPTPPKTPPTLQTRPQSSPRLLRCP